MGFIASITPKWCSSKLKRINALDGLSDDALNGGWNFKDYKRYVVNLEKQHKELMVAVALFLDTVEEPPEADCRCHTSPPCMDCFEYGGLRKAFEAARTAIAKANCQDERKSLIIGEKIQ